MALISYPFTGGHEQAFCSLTPVGGMGVAGLSELVYFRSMERVVHPGKVLSDELAVPVPLDRLTFVL